MHKNYTLVKEQEIEYLREKENFPGNCRLLKHKTGATVVFIDNGDPISVFSLSFLTPPTDDTGVAHIVEHCLLSGSEKYPVKDPSAELGKSAVHTYLNAMTFNDRTIYMGGSYNETSLFHMMDVYYDAVFRPNIYKVKETFLREGWHFEYDNDADEIGISGIVYNEMKASYGNPLDMLFNTAKRGLFPDSNMRFNNAGISSDVPNLTYEQFLAYYNNHYTPDNCTAFFYGTLDQDKCLDKLDHYLCNAMASGSFIRPEKPIISDALSEVYLTGTYILPDNDGTQNKKLLSLVYVLEDGDYFNGGLLQNILIGSVASPLYDRLMKMKFAENIFGSFNTEYGLPSYFYIVAQNCGDNIDIEYFKNAVEQVLSDIVKSGIDKEIISNTYHFTEIFYREKDFGYRTSGIVNALDCSSCIIKDEDIFVFLDRLNYVLRNKEQGLNERYFEDLTQKILDSKRRAYTTFTPTLEHNRLKHDIIDNLTDEQREFIKNDKTLKGFNDMPDSTEDLAKIPHLNLSDMKKEITPAPPYEVLDNKILTVPLKSNGISYLNFSFDASYVPKELWSTLGLMCNLLKYIGTAKTSYIEFANKISKYVSCFSWENLSYTNFDNLKFRPNICLTVKMLNENAKDVFALACESVNDIVFTDRNRLTELITSYTASWRNNISFYASHYATTLLSSNSSVGGLFHESCSGLTYMHYISGLNGNLDALCEDLTKVYNIVFNKKNLFISIGAEHGDISGLTEQSLRFFDSITEKPADMSKLSNINDIPFTPQTVRKAIIIPSESAFNTISAHIPYENIETDVSLNVLTNLLHGNLLTPEIRLKGGAYGCSAWYNDYSRFSADSYRDPHIAVTYDVFQKIPSFIKNFNFTKDDIEKVLLPLLSSSDRPNKPMENFALAMIRHFTRRGDEYYQKFRDNYFSMNVEKIRSLAPKFEKAFSNLSICTLAGKSQIEKNKVLFDSIEQL